MSTRFHVGMLDTVNIFITRHRLPALAIIGMALFYIVEGYAHYNTSGLIYGPGLEHDFIILRSFDGELYRFFLRSLKEWSDIFSVNVLLPLGGLYNYIPPTNNIWISPGWLALVNIDPPFGVFVAAAIYSGIYMAMTFALSRTFNVSVTISLLAAQMLFVATFPHIVSLKENFTFGFIQFYLIPAVAYTSAILNVIFIILVRANAGTIRESLIKGAVAGSLLIYSIVIDPMWTITLGMSLIPLGLPFMIGEKKNVLLARGGIVMVAILLVAGSGLLEYLMLVPKYTARFNFPTEMSSQPQTETISSFFLFATIGDNGLIKAFKIFVFVGWVFALIFGDERKRRLTIGCMIHGIILSALSVVFLYTTINWSRFPVPGYLDVAGWPFYMIATFAGFGGALTWARSRVPALLSRSPAPLGEAIAAKRLPRMPIHIRLPDHRWILILPALLLLYGFPAPSLLFKALRDTPRAEATKPIDSRNDGLSGLLAEKIGVHPGMPFRGALTTMSNVADSPYLCSYNTLLGVRMAAMAKGVPSIEEYHETITPQLYYIFSRLLARAGDWQCANFTNISKVNTPILQMLGARYLLTDNSKGIPGSVETHNVVFPNMTSLKVDLVEFPDPNLGNYSPTLTRVVSSAPRIVAEMGDPKFDPRREALVDEEISDPLVPAARSIVIPEKEGIRVQASSEGTSLLLLPVQYTHCLVAEGETPVRLLRTNLAMTGLLFEKSADVVLRFKFGFFSTACRRLDIADMKRLSVESDGTVKLPPPSINHFHLHGFRSNMSIRLSDLAAVRDALEAFRKDHGRYPISAEVAKTGNGWAGFHWNEVGENWLPDLVPKYLERAPLDPRDSPDAYPQYIYYSDGRDYKLISLGAEDFSDVSRRSNLAAMVDPARPNNAYGYWTPGAKMW